MDSKLKIVSYNCKHFVTYGDKFTFIDELFSDCDLLFLQELCMYQSEFHKLLSLGGSTDMIATSAMDESVHRVGRPFGGCAIVWSASLNPIRSGGGGGGFKSPPLRFFALTHLILELHYCALVTFPKK